MFKRISRRRLLKSITVGLAGLGQLTSCSVEEEPVPQEPSPAEPLPISEDDSEPEVLVVDSSDTPVLSALRNFGTNWQTFWACDLSNQGGRLGVFIDSSWLYEGDLLLPENDYTGLVKAINLSPGAHTYQMIIDGLRVGPIYKFTTGPETGDDFSILFIGDTTLEAGSAFNAICSRETNIACVVGAELHYLDTRGLFGGKPDLSDGNSGALTSDEPISKNNYQNHIRGQYRFSRTVDLDADGRNLLDNKWPLFNVPGNHDLFISDSQGWDSLRRQPGRCLYDAAHDAAFEYVNNGHPTADGITDSEPSPIYYFNKTIADVDLIVTDGISYSDPFAIGYLGKNTHANNKCTAGDDLQEAWLLNRLADSTANLIILVFSTMQHGSTGNWSQTIASWLKVNHLDKSIIVLSPDTHQSFARFQLNGLVAEIGFSPTAAVTSAKNYYANNMFGTLYDTDMFNKTAIIVGDQVFSGVVPAIINVDDASLFRVGRRMSTNLGGQFYNVVDVSDTTISITNNNGGAPSLNVNDGDTIYSIDWPDQNDVLTDSVGKALCTYGKVTRHPNGTAGDSNPHTVIQLIETYTGNIKFECRVRDGGRAVSF